MLKLVDGNGNQVWKGWTYWELLELANKMSAEERAACKVEYLVPMSKPLNEWLEADRPELPALQSPGLVG